MKFENAHARLLGVLRYVNLSIAIVNMKFFLFQVSLDHLDLPANKEFQELLETVVYQVLKCYQLFIWNIAELFKL